MARKDKVRSLLAPNPKRMLRYRDLMDEYGLTRDAAYDLLHGHGVKLAGGLYIKRSVAEKVIGDLPPEPA